MVINNLILIFHYLTINRLDLINKNISLISWAFLLIHSEIFCQHHNPQMHSKVIIYISEESSISERSKKLNVGDTLVFQLERILGNAENWKLKNNYSNIPGLKFLGIEEPQNDGELEGDKSLLIYNFLIVNKVEQTFNFEFGRVLGKSFELIKTVNINISAE